MYFGHLLQVKGERICFRCAVDPVLVESTCSQSVDTGNFVKHGYYVFRHIVHAGQDKLQPTHEDHTHVVAQPFELESVQAIGGQLMQTAVSTILPRAKGTKMMFFIDRSPILTDPLLGFSANKSADAKVDTGPSLRVVTCVGPHAIQVVIYPGSHRRFSRQFALYGSKCKKPRIQFFKAVGDESWVKGLLPVKLTREQGDTLFYDDRVILSLQATVVKTKIKQRCKTRQLQNLTRL